MNQLINNAGTAFLYPSAWLCSRLIRDKRMESLISKKAALLARLPANEPASRATPSAPRAPLDTPDNRAPIEIHPEPLRSHSTATLSSGSGRKN